MLGVRAVLRTMREDLNTVVERDPSISGRVEALLHPHIAALWLHRIAHVGYRRGHRILARLVGTFARFATGIEIHPGAVIGRRFFIDHGSAVVIGETVVIGDDVMLYHQVTLGSVGWWRDRDNPGQRRHPIIEDGVIIGTNASVLGGITVGCGSRIGAHAVLTRSVPARSTVAAAHGRVGRVDWPADVLITAEPAEPPYPPARPRSDHAARGADATQGARRP
jgi:serine O-acetyltransferase